MGFQFSFYYVRTVLIRVLPFKFGRLLGLQYTYYSRYKTAFFKKNNRNDTIAFIIFTNAIYKQVNAAVAYYSILRCFVSACVGSHVVDFAVGDKCCSLKYKLWRYILLTQ